MKEKIWILAALFLIAVYALGMNILEGCIVIKNKIKHV